MKKYALLLSAFLVCIKVAATTEHPIDFSVSTLEHDMSFKIVSSVNKTVSLSGDQEYDDGDYYYDPAVTYILLSPLWSQLTYIPAGVSWFHSDVHGYSRTFRLRMSRSSHSLCVYEGTNDL